MVAFWDLVRGEAGRGSMFTIVGAVLGFVVGGGLAILAFIGGMVLASIDAESQGWLLLFFSVPVFLLGGIVGLTLLTIVGARIDRSNEMKRRILWRVYAVIGALFVVSALPTIISPGWGIGIAALAVGAVLCIGAWWLSREMS